MKAMPALTKGKSTPYCSVNLVLKVNLVPFDISAFFLMGSLGGMPIASRLGFGLKIHVLP